MAEVPEHLLRALSGAAQGARSPHGGRRRGRRARGRRRGTPRRGRWRHPAARRPVVADGWPATATRAATTTGGGEDAGDAASRPTCSSGPASARRRSRWRRRRRRPRRAAAAPRPRWPRHRLRDTTGPGGHTQRLLTVVKSGSIQQTRAEAQDKVHTWPHLVVVEFASMLILLAGTTIFSALVRAPLLGLADFNKTPNPSKAPWYFLGLQELLTMFHPMVAGVTIPGVGLGLLALSPVSRQEPVAQAQRPQVRRSRSSPSSS